jgi:aminoglycoside phosphotransferase family enzyme
MKRQSKGSSGTRSRQGEARLRAFLTNPRSYAERPARLRLIETHASYLVLAARHAYKVKKSVNFGFLDFSTLAKRHVSLTISWR